MEEAKRKSMLTEYNTLRRKAQELHEELEDREKRSGRHGRVEWNEQQQQIAIQNELSTMRKRIAELRREIYPTGGRYGV